MSGKYSRINILLPFPHPETYRFNGDYYFGMSLGAAFSKLGLKVRFTHGPPTSRFRRYLDYLRRFLFRTEVDFILHGPSPHRSLPGKRTCIWVISKPDSVSERELEFADHVFSASDALVSELTGKGISASILHQCTEAHHTAVTQKPDFGIVFVGNRHFDRKIVENALELGLSLDIWGWGWDDIAPAGMIHGHHIANADLPQLYANARVVLNDHSHDMLRFGCVSNRVYDVLASGTPIVTEDMDGIPEDIRPYLHVYSDKDSLKTAIQAALDEDGDRQERRKAFAAHVRENHSFDQRAREVMDRFLS